MAGTRELDRRAETLKFFLVLTSPRLPSLASAPRRLSRRTEVAYSSTVESLERSLKGSARQCAHVRERDSRSNSTIVLVEHLPRASVSCRPFYPMT